MIGTDAVDPGRDVPPDLLAALESVAPPDPSWSERAAVRQGSLGIFPGSLGRLLDLGRQLASVQRTDRPAGHPSMIAVFAADHGVTDAGVSAYPPELTGQMVANVLRGGAAVNVMARRAGAEVRVVDLGVRPWSGLHDTAAQPPHFYDRSLGAGTSNFLDGPAMTRSQAFRAFRVGLALGDQWVSVEGFRVVALGELGIGNTTTAAALIAALTDVPVEAVVGRGTGIDDRTLATKRRVVDRAIELHGPFVHDLWEALSELGGYEILGLAGLAISAARHRALVVIDGLASSASALIAARLCPVVVGSLVAAHLGPEPGHRVVLDELGLRPLLDLGLRLGEGTGAALALPIIAAAADVLRDIATFEVAGLSPPLRPQPVGGLHPES